MVSRMCIECKRLNKDCKGVQNNDFHCIAKEANRSVSRLLTQLRILEVYEARASEAEKEYEADPMNEQKEQEFDKWYKLEFNQYIKFANEIVEYTANKIDFNTAKKMIQKKRFELFALFAE